MEVESNERYIILRESRHSGTVRLVVYDLVERRCRYFSKPHGTNSVVDVASEASPRADQADRSQPTTACIVNAKSADRRTPPRGVALTAQPQKRLPPKLPNENRTQSGQLVDAGDTAHQISKSSSAQEATLTVKVERQRSTESAGGTLWILPIMMFLLGYGLCFWIIVSQ